MSTELALRTNEIKQHQEPVIRALPAGVDPDRFIQAAIACLHATPELANTTRKSFFSALVNCAQLGLEPSNGLGHVYIVPFSCKGVLEAQVQIGYRGLIELAYRSGKVLSLYAHAVHEKDYFDYELGTTPRCVHRPFFGADPGPLVAVYAVCRMRGTEPEFEVMPRAAIEKIRLSAPSKNSPAWRNWYEEMAKAKVIKRLAKRLPLSVHVQDAVELSEQSDHGISQKILNNAVNPAVADDCATQFDEEVAEATTKTTDLVTQASTLDKMIPE